MVKYVFHCSGFKGCYWRYICALRTHKQQQPNTDIDTSHLYYKPFVPVFGIDIFVFLDFDFTEECAERYKGMGGNVYMI